MPPDGEGVERTSGAQPAAMPRGPVLQIAGITCRFGDRVVLDKVSVEVWPGQAVAVLGPNGAGKSTFLRSVLGTIGRGGGAVALGGKPLRDTDPRIRAAVATAGDDTDFFDDLSVAEHLNLVAAAHGVPEPNEAAGEVATDIGLLDAWEQLPATLSQGQRRRLALGLALVRPRQVLILDEPEQRLDVDGRQWLARRLLQEKADGVAVLFASHDPALVDAVADERLVLGDGGETPR